MCVHVCVCACLRVCLCVCVCVCMERICECLCCFRKKATGKHVARIPGTQVTTRVSRNERVPHGVRTVCPGRFLSCCLGRDKNNENLLEGGPSTSVKDNSRHANESLGGKRRGEGPVER